LTSFVRTERRGVTVRVETTNAGRNPIRVSKTGRLDGARHVWGAPQRSIPGNRVEDACRSTISPIFFTSRVSKQTKPRALTALLFYPPAVPPNGGRPARAGGRNRGPSNSASWMIVAASGNKQPTQSFARTRTKRRRRRWSPGRGGATIVAETWTGFQQSQKPLAVRSTSAPTGDCEHLVSPNFYDTRQTTPSVSSLH